MVLPYISLNVGEFFPYLLKTQGVVVVVVLSFSKPIEHRNKFRNKTTQYIMQHSNFIQRVKSPPYLRRYQREILYQDCSTSCGRGANCSDFEPSQHPGALVISNTKFLLATRSPTVVGHLPSEVPGLEE